MYNDFIFIGYMSVGFVGLAGLSLIFLLLIKGDSHKSVLYKSMRFFVINIICVGILYFYFCYEELVFNNYETGVLLRVLDYLLCSLLPYNWCKLIMTFADENKPLRLFRWLIGLLVTYVVIFIPLTVFFMDGHYYIMNDAVRKLAPIISAVVSIPILIFIIGIAIEAFKGTIPSIFKKYIVVGTLCLFVFRVEQLKFNIGLTTGNYGMSAWSSDIPDFISPALLLISLMTIVVIYKTDFSPLFEAPKDEKKSDDISMKLDSIANRHKLTQREREVIELVYQGLTNPDIANKLFVSRNTVKHHIHNIFEKLDVSTRMELVHLINNQK